MKQAAYLWRLFNIIWTLRTCGLLSWLNSYHARWFLQLISAFDGHSKDTPLKERARQLRLCLEHLGPIFIKFGQLLSTRIDLLPEEVILELVKLQDKVPPFKTEEFISIIEKTLQKPLAAVFIDFQPTPLGSASIAQVHAARLFSGEDVVIKILRPEVSKQILGDVAVLKWLAHWIERALPGSKRFRPLAVVEEFEHTLVNELDLTLEAANAAQLRRNFQESNQLYVPKVYWEYTFVHMLVIERIYGVHINDLEHLHAKNTNLKKLAENGVEIFFTQVFRDSFFHADMHPGNVFVDITNPEAPCYAAVDFGIMGSLNKDDKHYLAENFLAFFNQDYRRVAELHVESGWVPASTRIEDFESAIRAVCEPIFERPLKEISFGQTLLRLFQTAQRFEMEVQPQLILLQKTLLTIEGVGRQLYPELDLWHTAKPYLERFVQEQMSFKHLWKHMRKQLPFWIEHLTTPPSSHGKTSQPPATETPVFVTQKSSSNTTLLCIGCMIAGSILCTTTEPLKVLLGLCLIVLGLFAIII